MDLLNLIIISGGSGTGKSTLAQALQEELMPEVWLHLSTDSIFTCLPQSVIQQANTYNDWSRVDAKSVTAAAYACLRALIEEGHKLVFECVVVSEVGARNLLRGIGDARPAFVGLTCSWEETKRRTLARGDRTVAEAQFGFKNAQGHLDLDYAFQTTTLAPARAAKLVAAGVREQREHCAWRSNLIRYP